MEVNDQPFRQVGTDAQQWFAVRVRLSLNMTNRSKIEERWLACGSSSRQLLDSLRALNRATTVPQVLIL